MIGLALVDRRQPRQRRAVVVGDVDHGLPRGDRPGVVAGPLAQARDLGPQRLLARRIEREVGPPGQHRRQPGAVAARAVDALEALERRPVLVVAGQRVLEAGARRVGVADAIELHRADVHPQRHRAVAERAGDASHPGRGFDPAALQRRQPIDLGQRLGRQRILGQPAAGRVERAHAVAQPGLGQAGDALVDRRALVVVVGDGQLGRQQIGQPRPVALLLVERLERVDDRAALLVGGRQQPLERRPGRAVARSPLDHAAVRVDRARGVAQLALAHVAQPEQEVGAGGVGLGHLGLAGQHVGQLAPAAQAPQHAIERGQRGRLVDVGRRGPAERGRRARQIGERLLVDLAQPHRVGVLELGVEAALGELPLEQRRQLGPRAAHLRQPLERAQEAQIGRVLVERAGPGLRRRAQVAAQRLVQVGQRRPLIATRLAIAGQLEAPLGHLDQPVGVAGGAQVALEQRRRGLGVIVLGQERLERGLGPGVAGQDLQHRAVAAERRLGLAQLGLAQPRRAVRELGPGRGLGGQERAAIEHVELLGPHPVAGVQPVELGQRGGVAGVGRQHRLEVGDRLVRIVQVALVDRGQVEPQLPRGRGVVGQRQPLLDHADQLAGVAAGAVQPLQRGQRRHVVGRGRQHLAVRDDRLRRALEHVIVERGDAVEQRQPHRRVVGQLGPARHHHHQLVGARLDRQQAIERRQRVGVVGRDLEHLPPRRDRRAVIAALGLVDLGQPGQREVLGRRVHRRRGAGGQRLAQRVPRPHPRAQRGELIEDVVAGRLDPPGPGQRRERHAEVAAAALVDRRDLHQRRDLIARVGLERQLGVEHHHQLLPPVAVPVDRLEHAERALAARLADRQPLERRQRALRRLGGQDLLVLIERAVEVAGVLLEHLGQRQPAGDLVGLAGRALDPIAEQVGEVVPALEAAVQPLERVGRALVVEPGRQAVGQIDHRAPRVDRARQIDQALLEHRRLARVQIAAQGVVAADRDHVVVDPDQRRPLLVPPEQRLGPRQQRQPIVVDRRGRRQRAPVGRAARPGGVEAAVVDRRGGDRQLAQVRRVAGVVVEDALVGGGQAGPVAAHRRQPVQLVADVRIARVLGQLPRVPAERAVEILELLLVEPRDAADQIDPRVGLALAVELHLVQPGQRGPVVARDVDRLEHLGGGGPPVGVAEQPLERGDRAGVAGVAAQRRGVALDRGGDVAQLLLVQAAQLDPQRDRLVERLDEAEPALVQIDQVAPAPLLAVHRVERRHRLGVAGVGLEHLLPRRDRVVGAAQRAGGQPGHLGQRRGALADVGHRQVGLARQDVVQRPGVGGAALGQPLLVDALEGAHRAGVVGLGVEDPLIIGAGQLEIALRRLRQVGDVEVQPALDRAVEHVVGDLAVDRHQVGLARQIAGQPVDLGDHLGQLGLGDRRPQRGDRRGEPAGGVAQPLLADPRDPHPQPRALARPGLALRRGRQHRRQLGVVAGRLVQRLEDRRGPRRQLGVVERLPHRGQRRRVRRLDRQHLGPALERVARPGQRPAQERRQLGSARDPIGVEAKVGHREPPLEDVELIGGPVGLAVQPGQLVERGGVVADVIEHLEVGDDRLARLGQHHLVDLGQAAQLGHLGGGVVGALDLVAQQLGEVAPAIAGLVQPLEVGQRRRVLRRLGQHVAPRGDRAIGIAEALRVELGGPGQVLDPARPAGLGLPSDDVAQRRPLLLLLVQPRQRRQRRRDPLDVAGVERDQRLVRGDRARVVAQRAIADLGDVLAQRHRHRQVAGRRGGRRVERAGGVVPAIVGRGQAQDRLGRRARRRVRRQGLGPGVERRAAQIQLALLDARHPAQQLRGLDADRGAGLDPQHPGQVLPQLVAQVQRLEDARHALLQRGIAELLLEQLAAVGVAGLRRDHLLEQLDRARAIVEVPRVQLGAPVAQRHLLAGRRPRQLGGEHRVELGPARALGVQPLERLVGRQVARLELEDAAVVGYRASGIAEHHLVERGQLGQRRQLDVRRDRHRHPLLEQRAQIVPA